jgi:hypothetical protein
VVHRLRAAGRVVHLPVARAVDTMTALRVVLAGTPPSPNRSVTKHYMANRAVFNQWKADTTLLAMHASDQAAWVRPDGRCRVTFLFRYPDRIRRDPDNAAASIKPVMDGLVAAGVLVDDDFAHVALAIDAEFRAPTRETVITVEVL